MNWTIETKSSSEYEAEEEEKDAEVHDYWRLFVLSVGTIESYCENNENWHSFIVRLIISIARGAQEYMR